MEDDYLLPSPNPPSASTSRSARATGGAWTRAQPSPRPASHPNDREAIDHLSALPDSINTTIQRWIQHTTQAWSTAY
ncbi:hypothetical protein AQJ84_27200 [Streptomyces resistomycificus]|uniref:hypothetical protein n=1 Tax=Streptomyces resistomycificus TaxID=67356 RepID=UPI00074400AD|nr:hypothetical protein [Streptomyces resistomycificus]KUN94369.1 hypothetical protein AQJ84_27200 [Streptomyces resistomycificus]